MPKSRQPKEPKPRKKHEVPKLAKTKRLTVVAFDVGETHTAHCALAAVTKPKGGIRIEPIDLDMYPLSKDASERTGAVVEQLTLRLPMLDTIDVFDVEQQAPIVVPPWKAKMLDPKMREALERSYAGNIVAYGIAQNVQGALKMAYPNKPVNSVSPQHKFPVLGIHKPVTKARRKTRTRAFLHSWLLVHAHKKRWRPFIDKFASHPKGDDMGDAFCAALARLLEIIASWIDIRRIRKKE